MDVFIWIIILCVSFTSVQTQSCKRETRCKISRIRSMKAADCYDKEMTTFSQCLPGDVEVVDISHNRIRRLTKPDLEKYSNIKMLYLNDNLIVIVDKETFEEKNYLSTLDLSMNAITKVPPNLFRLPSLTTVYLGQNVNMNIVEFAEKTKPVTSPLHHLDISYIMTEEPNELPEFGLLPSLEKYNISGNKVTSINAKHFAGLCSLKNLDTTNVSIEHGENRCDCWTVNRWLHERKVIFKPFLCTVPEPECEDGFVDAEDLELYQQCEKKIQENLKNAKIKTALVITIPIGAAVFLVAVICIVVRRRRKQKKQRTRNKGEDLMLNNTVTLKL